MESQPQNPEFRNTPENFHPCVLRLLKFGVKKEKYHPTPLKLEIGLSYL